MRKIIIVLILFSFIACSKQNDPSNIKIFFETMLDIQCVDSLQNKFAMKFKYSTFNPEKMTLNYIVPDSISNSEFYNAYSGILISAFYDLINSDSTTTINELLKVNKPDEELVKEKVMNYCQQNKTWNKIFSLAESGFYENDKMNKTRISIDSLANISMSYFDIAGYKEERGFMYHFVCGANPFDFKPENAEGVLLFHFCEKALRNPEMAKVHGEIINDISNLIENENDKIDDFQKIKRIYEPKLHELLKENNVLRESLIAYYEKRKNIEPFILEY